MVDAVVGYAVNRLGDYLVQETSLLLGVKDEVEGLKRDLECLQGFLKDAMEDENEKSNAFKVWIDQARDLAYEAEDILDTYLLRVKQRDKSKRKFLESIKWSSRSTHAYNVGNDIRSLKMKINDLSHRFETYCNKPIGAQKATSSKLRRLKEIRRAPSIIEEEHVAGVEDDVDILLGKLLNGDSKTYMISIFGTGGLGKTAVARKLYNSAEVKGRFDYRGWTCVSQEFETKDLLKSIIKSFGGVCESELDKIESMAIEDLERYLRTFLQRKRYLVVVDDVWKKEAWESLKTSFPRNEGSRVIMTTRIKDIAEGVDEKVYAHNLRFLKFEESWRLFHRKAFRDHETVNRDMEEMGRDMVRRCHGLPLAIIILAGILSRKEENEWREVHDLIWASIRDNSIHISSLLDLSFNDLHFELKLCFLYLSIFPEDVEINVQKLIHLLVAEGFIQEDKDGKTSEEMAEVYIRELIDKSLVQVGKRVRGKIITCRVHDLLRDLAIKKAKELNFINAYYVGRTPPSLMCWRVVVHHTSRGGFTASNLSIRLRSLFFFGETREAMHVTMHDLSIICRKLKLLRVLDLRCLYWTSIPKRKQSLPEAIGELIHLRFLGLRARFLHNLPTSISNLHCLQTLGVFQGIFEKRIDLRKLISLRHIYGFFCGDLLIGDAACLQTLKSITSCSWSKINREKLINLRELEITDPSRKENTGDIYLGMDSFSKLEYLRNLKVQTVSFKFSHAEYPLNLESLSLQLLELNEDPMPMLEKLPTLEDLHLQIKDYPRKKLICSGKGFPRIKTLTLIIPRLEEVHIKDDAMPTLMEWEHGLQRYDVNPSSFMIPERLKAVIKTFLVL